MNLNTRSDIQTYLKQAETYANQANWSQTIVICQQVIEYCHQQLDNSLPAAKIATYLSLGDRALSLGNTPEAIAQYNQALNIARQITESPVADVKSATRLTNLPQINQKLGEAFSQQHRWSEAAAHYRRAIELNQTSTGANSAPNSALIQSQTASTARYYEQAVAIEPNSAELLANLGNLYREQQQWQKAIACYQKALAIKPNFSEVCRNLAQVLELAGQPSLAADYWYRAVQLEPDWATPEKYLKLGTILEQQQKPEPAIACYSKAIALNPQLKEAYIRLGVIWLNLGRLKLAFKLQQQFAHRHPNSAELYLYQGILFQTQQKLPEATVAYQQAIRVNPQLWDAYYQLAGIFLEEEQWSEAITAYHRALVGKKNFSWLYHHLGYANLKLQRWSESYQAFTQAIALNPNFVWSYVHLAEAAMAMNRGQKAIAALLKAVFIQQDLPGVSKKLGIVLRKEYLKLGSTIELNEAALQRFISTIPQLHPDSDRHQIPEFYSPIAADLSAEKQYIGAAIFYSLANQLKPNDLQFVDRIEQVKQLQQQLETHISKLRQNIHQNPRQPWSYIELGNTLADIGEFEEAISLHRQTSVLHGWHIAQEIRAYQFHYNWFTHNIPVWQQHLQSLAHSPIKILEIGSFEGMATCWLLDYILTHPAAQITCIDLYFQDNFERNITQTKDNHKVKKLKGNSHHILPTLPSNNYDVLYIDGSHEADDVKQDATLAWDLLKVNGIMIFDDYLLKMPQDPEQEPKIGIDSFLQSIQNEYKILHREYQLLIKKVG